MSSDTIRMVNRVRGALRPSSGLADGSEESPAMNSARDVLVAQALPPLTELVRMGNSWVTQMLTANAVAPVTAVPTTAAMLQLYNGESAGGRSYIIDSVFSYAATSEGAADGFQIIGQIAAPGAAAAPTAHASLQTNLSGKAGTSPCAVIGRSVTTATANKWFLIGNCWLAASTTTFGMGADIDVKGGIIIRPGGSLFLHTLAEAAAAATMVMGVRWHEVLLDLG